jgi:hypothetical protein
MRPPFVSYAGPMPEYPIWPAPPCPEETWSGTSIVVQEPHEEPHEEPHVECDLRELLDAVVALPPPVTEAGMRLTATVAKLKERQRQRLGLPEDDTP